MLVSFDERENNFPEFQLDPKRLYGFDANGIESTVRELPQTAKELLQ